ncbi:4Fe-4S dicluster domain-containing protein, partial [Acidobacteriota bacterium]
YCQWACPYAAPQFDAVSGVMTKCDLCYDTIEQGKPPACVAACQMRVIAFGDIEELREKYGAADAVYPLPQYSLTEPSVVFTPHRDSEKAETASAAIANQEEIESA